LNEHPNIQGGDVSFPSKIPPSWIESVEVVPRGKALPNASAAAADDAQFQEGFSGKPVAPSPETEWLQIKSDHFEVAVNPSMKEAIELAKAGNTEYPGIRTSEIGGKIYVWNSFNHEHEDLILALIDAGHVAPNAVTTKAGAYDLKKGKLVLVEDNPAISEYDQRQASELFPPKKPSR
jgi:hypothetical protein